MIHPTIISQADRAAFEATNTREPKVGSLVEAPVIGTLGTMRVIEGPWPAQPGHVWLRETGLTLPKGEPFVVEWSVTELRIVAE